ncbi:hypothetical protein BVC80_8779g9 [Macleaya cordata]|uniref:F-box associated beta-propeller type 3 domain-containing protein n=1 Tax=Macleaya cordata TaxID=56857 RepID=A0A200QAF4_MACCD|nr:hypothetical protein BVC80_8779g9 [Macleaya cordata]
MGLLFSIGLDYDKCGSAVQLYYGGQYDHEINNIDDDDDDDKHNDYSSYKTLTKIDHPPITERPLFDLMLGSCNGLVCFFVPHDGMDDPIYICNPITGEYVYLPRFTCGKHASSHHKLVGGFGYLHSTNEYKVVRTYYDYDEPSLVGHVQVYTLGDGNGWRNKGDTTHFIGSSGVFANGYLHWIDIGAKKNIVAFDLAEEEFRLLPSPPCLLLRSRNLVYFSLQLLGGCLCVVCIDKGKCVDIWALKNKKKKKNSSYDDEDNSWSWSREFSIAWEGPD